VFTARYVLPTQCICVLCGSENKQRLFPSTTIERSTKTHYWWKDRRMDISDGRRREKT
jgi:hypothetical protein